MTDLPAHDVAAEQALLGAALAAPDIAGPALLTVPSEAWWNGRHKLIAAAISDRLRRDQPVDPTLILAVIVNRRGAGDDIGAYLITLMERAWAPGNAAYHADRIRRCAAARDLSEICTRTVQRIAGLVENGDELDLAPLVADLNTRATEAAIAAGTTALPTPRTVLDLLRESDTYDWLVPGLLERTERIILTAAEGVGKSVFITQTAACLAGGIHPFAGVLLESGQLRVTVVDCENPSRLARRRYRTMLPLVERLRTGHAVDEPSWGEHLFIDFRGDGLDLLNGRDVAWLENYVAATSPGLLVIGPIYKLHRANINDELAAREVTTVLDGIRTRHGCALLMEAHAGHTQDSRGRRALRPRGSSLFLGWPEFGYGLSRSDECPDGQEHPSLVDFVAWRGGREKRSWPLRLRHGHTHRGELPWTPDQRGDNVVPLAGRDAS